jgi:hypothetical protein
MNATNRTLLALHQHRVELPQQNLFLYLLLGSKIREFGNKNNVKINALIEKVTKLQKEFFVFEGDRPKFEGEEGKQEPVMNKDMLRSVYDQKYEELMAMECHIDI